MQSNYGTLEFESFTLKLFEYQTSSYKPIKLFHENVIFAFQLKNKISLLNEQENYD